MKKLIIILIFFFVANFTFSQENNGENRGTIRIQKRGQLSKIQFDNVNYRLIGVDQYGNAIDSAVVEFEMSVTISGIFYSEKTVGPILSYNMRQLLGRSDRTTKIFFEKIKAKDRNGTLIDMPKFQYSFGYFDENND
ncbi:MAG: hypothetical protein K8R85_12990 [Bacteroidetes bacterium]|nr:hypothetical protein [Bacteroidota bacterium]